MSNQNVATFTFMPDQRQNVNLGSQLNINFQDLINSLVPAGCMLMYGAASAPTGWLLCDGTAVSRTAYADLFAAIGTTFGTGDGSTTFNVPDLRGIFPKGAGQQGTASFAGANYAATLGTYSQDKFQGHKHNVTGAVWLKNAVGGSFATPAGAGEDTSNAYTQTNDTVRLPVTDSTNGTPRTGATTEPASLGVTYIIKF